jgi:hypothetical protein
MSAWRSAGVIEVMYEKDPPNSKTGWAQVNASLASGAADRTRRRTASCDLALAAGQAAT